MEENRNFTIEKEAIVCNGMCPQNTLVFNNGITSLSIEDLHFETYQRHYFLIPEVDLVTKIIIPDGVTKIGTAVFYECKGLESVEIPNSVTEIGIAAFARCKSLRTIDIPDSVTEIKDNAFAECRALESVHIPESVSKIEKHTFSHCLSLKDVNIPDGTEIERYAFFDCSSLESIVIPDSVYINPKAFLDCPNLTVSYRGKEFPAHVFENENIVNFINDPNYNNLLKLNRNDMKSKIILSMIYYDELKSDKKFTSYLKRNIDKIIDYIVETEDVEMLDALIYHKLIGKRVIDKCLDCIKDSNFYEAFVQLAQYKSEIGGYDRTNQDRFQL